jgi:hypothetical protein
LEGEIGRNMVERERRERERERREREKIEREREKKEGQRERIFGKDSEGEIEGRHRETGRRREAVKEMEKDE